MYLSDLAINHRDIFISGRGTELSIIPFLAEKAGMYFGQAGLVVHFSSASS